VLRGGSWLRIGDRCFELLTDKLGVGEIVVRGTEAVISDRVAILVVVIIVSDLPIMRRLLGIERGVHGGNLLLGDSHTRVQPNVGRLLVVLSIHVTGGKGDRLEGLESLACVRTANENATKLTTSLEMKSAGIISASKHSLSFAGVPSVFGGGAGLEKIPAELPTLDILRNELAYGAQAPLGRLRELCAKPGGLTRSRTSSECGGQTKSPARFVEGLEHLR